MSVLTDFAIGVALLVVGSAGIVGWFSYLIKQGKLHHAMPGEANRS